MIDSKPMKMNPTRGGLFVIAASCLLLCSNAAAEWPNILFIITDDQDRKEFNFLPEGQDERGHPRNLSPNIDRLAGEGVVFLNQYVSSPVCTPSRYSVLTGTYASRAKDFAQVVADNRQVNITWNSHIESDTPNLGRTLNDAGYFTGAVGKNHVVTAKGRGRGDAPPDDADPRDPKVAAYYAEKQRRQVEAFRACGFDYAASLYAGNLPGHTCKALEYHNMDWITSGALNFLDTWQETDQPFFLYLATTLNHGPGPRNRKYTGDPLATPAGLLDAPLAVQPARSTIPERVKAAGLPLDGPACDVLWMDDGIGAILDTLESLGALENTIVFFFDDHGVEDGKGSLYQGGIRSVSFVWSPRHVKGGRQTRVNVSNIDFVPTILDLCQVPRDEWYALDGKSFVPVLQGSEEELHDYLFFEMGATRAVLKDGWKYVAFRLPPGLDNNPAKPYTHLADRPGGRGSEQPAIRFYPNYFHRDQLYDLASDPLERSNLYHEEAEQGRAENLKALLREAVAQMPGSFAEFTATPGSTRSGTD
jgi:arylsulfatase A-like enzyme